jgi:glycosyltransferase involved in cell wall biosynthesis
MACGTPVVAFDSPGGTAEIIRHGRNGWLVPAEDWKALGKMLAEVAGQRAWETMPPDDLLPEEYACSNVVNLYERLLEEDRGPVSGRS